MFFVLQLSVKYILEQSPYFYNQQFFKFCLLFTNFMVMSSLCAAALSCAYKFAYCLGRPDFTNIFATS